MDQEAWKKTDSSFPSWGAKTPLRKVSDQSLLAGLELQSIALRRKILNLGETLQIRLHYGAILSIADILTVLYFHWLRFQKQNPSWSDRDRFVLSKGHGAPALYAVLSLCGILPDKEFSKFRCLGSKLQGHPDRNKTPGVESCSGSLGQGFGVACGMALSAKIDRASFRAYTLIGDGECNEGSIWEAAMVAANLNLTGITVLLDRNHKSAYAAMKGRNDIEPLADKWKSFGWTVFECDGHNMEALTQALDAAEKNTAAPSVILCNTVKGKGIPFAEKNPTRSNFALTPDQYHEALASLEAREKEILSHA